jgi:hypothetical protein
LLTLSALFGWLNRSLMSVVVLAFLVVIVFAIQASTL